MSHQQIPIHLVNCLFVLLIISLAVQIFFQFDEVLFVYFVFVCLARRAMSEKKVFLKEMSEISLPVYISSSIVLGMTCKSFIDFGFFLVYVIRSSFSFIFYICVSNFPGTIYLIDCFYLIVCVCLLLLSQINRLYSQRFISGISIWFLDLCICFYAFPMLF